MKARLISVLLVIALLVTVGVIAAQAAAEATFECGCGAENVVEINNATFADGASLTAGSYKLTEKLTTTLVVSEGTVCVDLNGFDIEVAEGLAIDVQGGALHLTAGDSVISGGNTDTAKDASTVYINGTAHSKLYGGEYVRGANGTQAVISSSDSKYLYLYEIKANSPETIVYTNEGADVLFRNIVYVYGGDIGYMRPAAATTVALYEDAKIERLHLQGAGGVTKIRESELTPGAKVIIHGWSSSSNFMHGDKTAATKTRLMDQIPFYFHSNPTRDPIWVTHSTTNRNGLSFTTSAKNFESRPCPVCRGEAIAWEEIGAESTLATGGALEAKHYYLTADLELTEAFTVAADTAVCVDLNGHSITSSGLVFNVASAGSLNVFNIPVTEATVTGRDANANASTILNAGALTLHSGIYKHTGSSKPTVYNTGTFNLKGSALLTAERAYKTVEGETVVDLEESVLGYNVYSTGTMNMSGGIIENGTNTDAGNVFVNSGKFTLKGGIIKDGIATGTDTDVRNNAGGNIRKYGGTLEITGGTVSGGTAAAGGNIYSRLGAVTMSGGVVEDGVAIVRGGNIYLNNVSVENSFSNCVIRNGSAPSAGNIYTTSTSSAKVTIGNGAQILNGEATGTGKDDGYGGNVYINNGNVDVAAGATISGGSAKLGGNICSSTEKTVTVAGTVEGGNANSMGGNIYNTGTLTVSGSVKDGTVGHEVAEDGTVTVAEEADGGNIYNTGTLSISGTVSGGRARYGGNILTEGASGNITVEGENAIISGGHGAGHGGNVYVRNGSFTLNSGKIELGTVGTGDGSGIYVRKGNVYLLGGKIISKVTENKAINTRQGSVVLGGTANTKKETVDGEVVTTVTGYNAPVLTIGGAFQIESEVDNEGIWLNDYSQMIVNEGFSGAVKLRTVSDFVPAYGSQYDVNNCTEAEYTPAVVVSATGEYTGTIALPQRENASAFFVAAGEGLVVAGAQKDGEWVAADALTNGTTGIKLYADATLTLADGETSVPVDLNGKNLAVNGSGKLDAFNSSTKAASNVTLDGVTTDDATTWNEAGYYDVVLPTETGATYHKLEMAIKSISLRPSAAGLYYTATMAVDETLANQIDSAGVLLGTNSIYAAGDVKDAMYGATNDNLATSDYFTSVAPATFNPSEITSVLVKNIFKEGAENNDVRGAVSVIGTPFVLLKDGTVLTCQTAKECSMQQYLMMADEQLADDAETLGKVLAFCEQWNVGTFGWNLPNLYPVASEPEATEPEATEAVPDNGGEL